MATFAAVFAVFVLAAAGLGMSYLVRGRALKGTCASQAVFTDGTCEVCGKTTACDAPAAKS